MAKLLLSSSRNPRLLPGATKTAAHRPPFSSPSTSKAKKPSRTALQGMKALALTGAFIGALHHDQEKDEAFLVIEGMLPRFIRSKTRFVNIPVPDKAGLFIKMP